MAEGRNVSFNLLCIDVGKDLEVTEFAPLAAVGDMQIKPKWGARYRR
jgi:hypothetical protein